MSEKINNNKTEQKNELLSRLRVQPSEDNHQLEFVDQINGIAFINDSKSIRVTATRNSLESIETSVVLIIGGNDAENDYSVLAQQIKQKVIAIIYLGTDNNKIIKHYSTYNMLFAKASTMNEAVQVAAIYARSGDAVLFSPACDNGGDHKGRGNEFKEIVKKLKA